MQPGLHSTVASHQQIEIRESRPCLRGIKHLGDANVFLKIRCKSPSPSREVIGHCDVAARY
jgi:hypothetical protein